MGHLKAARGQTLRLGKQLRGRRPPVQVGLSTQTRQDAAAHLGFRWCYTYAGYFAISTNVPSNGAVVNVHNVSYLQTQPTPFTLAPHPHIVRDFDFLSLPGIPKIAAAYARTVTVFPIGVDS